MLTQSFAYSNFFETNTAINIVRNLVLVKNVEICPHTRNFDYDKQLCFSLGMKKEKQAMCFL